MTIIIGIDLGTSSSAAAVLRGGRPVLIPSDVAITADGQMLVGEPVTKAVIAVPAYFDENQRSATKDAAGIAGLGVVRLVNEPTAATLAYGFDHAGQESRIAVIDLGGGTLDDKLLADFATKLTAELTDRIEQARRATKEACNSKDAALATDRTETTDRAPAS